MMTIHAFIENACLSLGTSAKKKRSSKARELDHVPEFGNKVPILYCTYASELVYVWHPGTYEARCIYYYYYK
jgi:hypothetical protein